MSLDPDDDEKKESKYLESKWGGLASVLLDDCASTFKLEEQDANTQYILGFLKELEEARRTDYGDFLTLMSTKRLDETSQNRLNSRLYDQLAWSFQQKIPIEPLSSAIYEGHVEAFRWLAFDLSKGMELDTQLIKQALATPNYRDEIFRDLVPYCSGTSPGDTSVEERILDNRNTSAFRIWLELSKRQGVYTDDEWDLLLSKACSSGFDEGIEIILPHHKPFTWYAQVSSAMQAGVSLKIVQAISDRRCEPSESALYHELLRFVADETKGNLFITRPTGPTLSSTFFVHDWLTRKETTDIEILFLAGPWLGCDNRQWKFLKERPGFYARPIVEGPGDAWPDRVHLVIIANVEYCFRDSLYRECCQRYPHATQWLIYNPMRNPPSFIVPILSGTVTDGWTIVRP